MESFCLKEPGLLGYVETSWGLLLGVLVSAVSGGAIVSSLTAYMGDQTSYEEQGVLMGLFSTSGDIGSMLGPLIALSIAPALNLNYIYFFSLLIYIFGMALVGIRIKLDSSRTVSEA